MEKQIELENLTITDIDVFGDWESLIFENSGEYSSEGQYICFDYFKQEVFVEFSLRISGDFWYIPESYLQPAEGEVNITSVEVSISTFTIDDVEIESKEAINEMEHAIAKMLKKDTSYLA
jgi:hypothetical protein